MNMVGAILVFTLLFAGVGAFAWVMYFFTFNPVNTRITNWMLAGAVVGILIGVGVIMNERSGYRNRDYSPAARPGISDYQFKKATGMSREEMEDRVRRRDRY